MPNVFPKNLGQGAISDSIGTHYTHDSEYKQTTLTSIVLKNTSASGVSVTLSKVPNNAGAVGTKATADEFYEATIAADSTVKLEYPLVFDAVNDTLQAIAATADVVNIFISGEQKA